MPSTTVVGTKQHFLYPTDRTRNPRSEQAAPRFFDDFGRSNLFASSDNQTQVEPIRDSGTKGRRAIRGSNTKDQRVGYYHPYPSCLIDTTERAHALEPPYPSGGRWCPPLSEPLVPPVRMTGRSDKSAVPTATLGTVPPEVLLDENFTFNVAFDNTSPTDVGDGPFVNLYLRATGNDGAGTAVNDGVTFVS